jgi:magnesium transporter
LVDVCVRLVRFDNPLVPEDARLYFRDVYDHVVHINESVDGFLYSRFRRAGWL